MTGKEMIRAAAKHLRACDPALHTRFDFCGDVYRHRRDPEPAFSYALRGDVRIDRRKLLSALALLLSLVLFRCFRRARRKL